MGLSENDRNVWKEANKGFASFKVGDKVLKGIQEKGRLNVNKMREKFKGPYVVKKVMSNGVSYLLEQLNNAECINEIRAHQVQLRPRREPPEYLREHSVHDMVRMEGSGNEGRDKGKEIDWESKELVLIEKRKVRKSESRKNVSGRGIDEKNDFSVFWWDTEEVTGGETYSVCKFSLEEGDLLICWRVSHGFRSMRYHIAAEREINYISRRRADCVKKGNRASQFKVGD